MQHFIQSLSAKKICLRDFKQLSKGEKPERDSTPLWITINSIFFMDLPLQSQSRFLFYPDLSKILPWTSLHSNSNFYKINQELEKKSRSREFLYLISVLLNSKLSMKLMEVKIKLTHFLSLHVWTLMIARLSKLFKKNTLLNEWESGTGLKATTQNTWSLTF